MLELMSTIPLIVSKPTTAHFERIGGQAGVTRLVEAFYAAMSSRQDAKTIRAMHASDLTATKAVLVQYFCEWMGGPRDYSAHRGHPQLRRRHFPFAVDDAARDAWLACMSQALAETSADSALNAELEAAFRKIADHLRNT